MVLFMRRVYYPDAKRRGILILIAQKHCVFSIYCRLSFYLTVPSYTVPSAFPILFPRLKFFILLFFILYFLISISKVHDSKYNTYRETDKKQYSEYRKSEPRNNS